MTGEMGDFLAADSGGNGQDFSDCPDATARISSPQQTLAPRRIGRLVAHTVSSAFLIKARDLGAPTRSGARIAHARQVAMYLAHVGLGLSYTDAGRLFGRDRTTAAYACRLVEERRDDPRFDASLEYMEQALRAHLHGAFGASLN